MTFIISQQFWNFWSTKPLDKYIWIKVAVGLSLGGNDFLPKFYGISHATN